MESGPRLADLHVVDTRVDARIEISERRGDRFDHFVGDARGRIQRLRLGDVPRLHRCDEGLGALLEQLRLRHHVAPVARDGRIELRAGGRRCRTRGTLDDDRGPDAGADHSRLARQLVMAGLERHGQLLAGAGADVAHLADDPVTGGVDEDLGDLTAAVGDGEGLGAAHERGLGDHAGRVGRLHRHPGRARRAGRRAGAPCEDGRQQARTGNGAGPAGSE